MKQQVNLEIMDFVEKQILPKYNAFGESHGLRHVTRVIRNSLKLVPVTGADIDMVYVIAAYHDLGMSGRVPFIILPAVRFCRQIQD